MTHNQKLQARIFDLRVALSKIKIESDQVFDLKLGEINELASRALREDTKQLAEDQMIGLF